MNILFLTKHKGIAGSAFSLMYLAQGLANRGHRVVLGCSKDSVLYQQLSSAKGIILEPFEFRGRFDLNAMRKIKELVETHQIQLINPQSGKGRHNAAYARLFFKLPVAIVHSRRQRPYAKASWIRAKFLVWASDKMVAVSHGVKKGLLEMGVPESHIHVIFNGTPPEKYQLPERAAKVAELRQKLKLSAELPVIGCVSRPKSQEQLLAALSYLDQPITLIFIGIEESENYRQLIQKSSLPHQVFFLGIIPPEETLYYYALFDIKILPSVMEGLSQSLLEAMAMGVPVIATNAAGNPDLITHGENGLLFDDQEVKTLAQHIQTLLSDQSLYQKLQQKGKATALEDFSIQKVITNYESFFEELIERTPKKINSKV